ncbi:hypothetical protein [Klebsiella sp. BIGb0407]|uniref:hypothetical protein n=1 Tax=Klebsiella sp. BIGb0407 TaxID=2940603 RepID=UPI0021671855|nr:hypothetical protein [Klebsiella sp. BIGb0407]MCS3430023.1 hypothetical protein [Klebsiella sp. BIGb0407]
MSTEKIAFLYPYHVIPPSNEKVPLLVLDADAFPLKVKISFELFFLGLIPDAHYFISLELTDSDTGEVIKLSEHQGIWIRATATSNGDKAVAASAEVEFPDCEFIKQGYYLITATINKDKQPIHKATAYFGVSYA